LQTTGKARKGKKTSKKSKKSVATKGMTLASLIQVLNDFEHKLKMVMVRDCCGILVIRMCRVVSRRGVCVGVDIIQMGLAEEEQRVREQAQTTGQTVDPKELQDYFREKFELTMEAVQKGVFKEHNVTEEEVGVAAKTYEGEEEYIACKASLHQLMRMMDPPSDVEVDDKWTMDVVVDVLRALMEGMSESMHKVCKEVRNELGVDASEDKWNARVNDAYLPLVEDTRLRVFTKYDTNQDLLHSCILKYQMVPKFAESMNKLTEEQRREMTKAQEIRTSRAETTENIS